MIRDKTATDLSKKSEIFDEKYIYIRIGSGISPRSRDHVGRSEANSWNNDSSFQSETSQLTSPVLQTAQEFVEFFVRGVRLLATQLHSALRPFMLLLSGWTEFWISPVLARF